MAHIADDGIHAFRHAQHPLHQVDVVHAVACHCTGRFLIPGAAPPQVVVTLAAPPQRIYRSKQHLADKPLVQDLFHLLVGGLAAVLHHHAQHLAAFLGGGNHGIALFQRAGHGLFADDMAVAVQSFHGDVRVHLRRQADGHCINAARSNGFFVFLISLCSGQAVRLDELLCFFREKVAHCAHLAQLRVLGIGLDMYVCNGTCANNGNADFFLFHLFHLLKPTFSASRSACMASAITRKM